MSAFDDLMKRVEALTKTIAEIKADQEDNQRRQRYALETSDARDAWQDSFADNVQSGYPLVLNLFIPEGNATRHIQDVRLTLWLEAFRSYGTGAAIGGGVTTGPSATTTTGPSATTTTGPSLTTTSGASSVTKTTTSQSSSTTTSETAHVHVDGDMAVTTTVGFDPADHSTHYHNIPLHNTLSSGAHSHTFGHTHDTDISHTHEIPSHTHEIPSHTHEIPSHTHTLNHTHDLVHGIYTGATASTCTITINGTDRTTALTGGATFSANQTRLDITDYIVKGDNTIQIASTTLGRIKSSIFTNVYLNR